MSKQKRVARPVGGRRLEGEPKSQDVSAIAVDYDSDLETLRKKRQEDIAIINFLTSKEIECEGKINDPETTDAEKDQAREDRLRATEYFLTQFEPYVQKYISLFHGTLRDARGADTRSFLAMFMTGRPHTPEGFAWAMSYIKAKMEGFPREDMEATMRLCLVDTLRTYRAIQGVDALLYITMTFRNRIKTVVTNYIMNPVSQLEDLSNSRTDESYDSRVERLIYKRGCVDTWLDESTVAREVGLLDEAWVASGEGASYEGLSLAHRLIIYRVYNLEETLTVAARRLHKKLAEVKTLLAEAFEIIRSNREEGVSP